MGTSSSPAQLGAKLQAAARELDRATDEAVRESAVRGKAIMLSNMGFTSMRGVGKRGGRAGVRYKLQGGTTPSALLSYFGPVHLANNDTKEHEIKPKRRGKKAILVAGQPVASAQHPGTTGKHFHEKSVPVVAKASARALDNEVSTALRRVF